MRSATAFAPATVSNVAVGFDILGFAIESAGDEVTVTISEHTGVRVAEITDTTGTLTEGAIPSDATRNTATVGLIKLSEDLRLRFGFDVSIRKGIALGSGMGGSAASAVAALVAANSLIERQLPKESLLAYALIAEEVACGAAHPDNATPCLFGGLTLMLPTDPPRHVQLPIPTGVLNVLVHPHVRVDTRDARRILKESVALADHVKQSANLGGFITGCFRDDLELIGNSLTDIIIEPQRAALIPGFAHVKAAALRAGAIGVSISGSGPSMFAWVDSEGASERVRAAMVDAFASNGVTDVDSWVSLVSQEGARVIR
jgi:homoserine kinase